MSTKKYPIWVFGNPQLRVFLPNFYLKLLRWEAHMPKNHVKFQVSMEMTKYDVKNYLEKIYSVPVASVRTSIQRPKTKKHPTLGFDIRDADYKIAHVVLAEGGDFEFPDVAITAESTEQRDKDMEKFEQAKDVLKRTTERNKHRPGMPTWFGL